MAKSFFTNDEYYGNESKRSNVNEVLTKDVAIFNTTVANIVDHVPVTSIATTKTTGLAIPVKQTPTLNDYIDGTASLLPVSVSTSFNTYMKTKTELFDRVKALCPHVDVDSIGLWDRILDNISGFFNNLLDALDYSDLVQGMIDCFIRIKTGAEDVGILFDLDVDETLLKYANAGNIGAVIALGGLAEATGTSTIDTNVLAELVISNMAQNDVNLVAFELATGNTLINKRNYYHMLFTNGSTMARVIGGYAMDDISSFVLSADSKAVTLTADANISDTTVFVDSVALIYPGMAIDSSVSGITDGTIVYAIDDASKGILLSKPITALISEGGRLTIGYPVNDTVSDTRSITEDMWIIGAGEDHGLADDTRVTRVHFSEAGTYVEMDKAATGDSNAGLYMVDIRPVYHKGLSVSSVLEKPIPGSVNTAIDAITIKNINANGNMLMNTDIYVDTTGVKMAAAVPFV